MGPDIKLFSFRAARPLAEDVARGIGVPLAELREEQFPDGEGKNVPAESVSGEHAVVFHSLAGEANHSPAEKICELAFLLHTLRDHGAREISVIAPYLAFSRSDQRHDALDSLYLKAVAMILEGAGLSRIITMDVHNLAAYENAFRSAVALNVEAELLFCEYLKGLCWTDDPLLVLSPDLGGIKRANKFRVRLEKALGRSVHFSHMEKYRREGSLEGSTAAASVSGAQVLIFDDMISTGGTILRAMEACQKAGAKEVSVLATHGIFSRKVEAILSAPLLRQLIVTDSNAKLRDEVWSKVEKLQVLPSAPLLAQSVSESLPGLERRRAA